MSNWQYFYKMRNGVYSTTNMLYSPSINPEGTVMCMDWSFDNPYQASNTGRTEELVTFFFERELKYSEVFKDYHWAPKIIDIDGRKIFIEWNKESCNTILFVNNQNLTEVCPTWKEQQFNILKDIKDAGYYKMALYPHCFFLDNAGTLKTIDFYGCIEMNHPYIERDKIAGIIGPDSGGRFDSATNSGVIDFSVFFKNTLLTHLGTIWPDNPFPDHYNKLFNE